MMKFKKILLALVSLILAVILCGCSSKSYIINSNIDDIEKKVNNNESFILYIGSKECHNCTSFTPKLEKIVNKNKISVYYIDTYNISDEDYNRLFKLVNYSGTPTLAFITEGSDPGSQTHLVGDVSSDKIESALKNNGYLK